MPLSEHEQHLLEQMEQALYAEDPKFASQMQGSAARARLRLVGVRMEGLLDSAVAPVQGLLDAPEHGWRDADRAVDQASARFGAGAVRPASLVEGERSATAPKRGDIS